ncbi:selenium cofactor biosynthesis protein YqeC [Clostridium sp. DJ247]|uniref:selenium cofactor biosynthesis protein YqeC n=1 Tax=Clostridium sp. DJ247 TaxID=2726188 RepID=UPI001626B0AC|nr:selenium cofactor biosynthesis protein YqeC [Clostridium sp. DJ247]MBC2581809.1 putative selenium-dependent hydroxylase accessory protein YqeC [Clostridium sp. DJ247]
MKLTKLINLSKNCIVSIVGAGGKTSLMFSIAQELRHQYKVLVTTTTKIYVPNKNQYDFITMLKNNYLNSISNASKGIYVYGNHINSEDKIIGLSSDSLEKVYKYFDCTLIEADGSKRKCIKGWRDDEPVIFYNTNKTIGVLDICSIGKKINEANVHRVNNFIHITNSKIDRFINIEHLISLVFHHKGLFKNSLGERILFINKVENIENKIIAQELAAEIIKRNNSYIDKVIIGSVKSKTYELI